MEPQVQYAKTSDGVSIAYWVMGDGPPLVHLMNTVFGHIQLEWHVPPIRRWYERLGQHRRLIRYDVRGTGLSDREVTDLSHEAHVRDLEAIVDHLGLDRFALLGAWQSGPLAIMYTARHPDRVSHLVLWHAVPRLRDVADSPLLSGILASGDWHLGARTLARFLMPWSDEEEGDRSAELIQESITLEALERFLALSREVDATPLLVKVKTPTLVLHRRQLLSPTVDVARALASGIPNARLALLEGQLGPQSLGDVESVLRAINEFLGDSEEAAAPGSAQGLVTILFTDIASSTALTQRLGDAKAQELLRAHNTIVRDALKAGGGAEIKHTGDGIMASFPTASGALECAMAIQRNMEQGTRNTALAGPVEVHIGLNAGEPIAEGADLFGTSVQLARRICDHAGAGEILVADVVRQLAAGKGFLFADRGDVMPKGFEEPVRLYELRWREEA